MNTGILVAKNVEGKHILPCACTCQEGVSATTLQTSEAL